MKDRVLVPWSLPGPGSARCLCLENMGRISPPCPFHVPHLTRKLALLGSCLWSVTAVQVEWNWPGAMILVRLVKPVAQAILLTLVLVLPVVLFPWEGFQVFGVWKQVQKWIAVVFFHSCLRQPGGWVCFVGNELMLLLMLVFKEKTILLTLKKDTRENNRERKVWLELVNSMKRTRSQNSGPWRPSARPFVQIRSTDLNLLTIHKIYRITHFNTKGDTGLPPQQS